MVRITRHRNRHGGFSYLALLMLVAIIGLAAGASVQLGSIIQRRQAEDELLFVGLQYQRAFRSYLDASSQGTTVPPQKLEDLLHDPRFPYVKRHIRQLYPDPMTGKMDWGIIHAANGSGILGVYSQSEATPIRIDHFPEDFFYFKGKTSYSDWVFLGGVPCDDNGCALDGNHNALPNLP